MSQLFHIWPNCLSIVHVLGIYKLRNIVCIYINVYINSFEEENYSIEKITQKLFEKREIRKIRS